MRYVEQHSSMRCMPSCWIDLDSNACAGRKHSSHLSVMSSQKSTVDPEAMFAAARSSKKWRALAPPLSFPSGSDGISVSKDSTSMTMLTPSSRLTKASWWSGTCRRSLSVIGQGRREGRGVGESWFGGATGVWDRPDARGGESGTNLAKRLQQ